LIFNPNIIKSILYLGKAEISSKKLPRLAPNRQHHARVHSPQASAEVFFLSNRRK